MLHKASSIRLSFYNSLCKYGPARLNVGESASGVQLGRAGILARRLVRVKMIVLCYNKYRLSKIIQTKESSAVSYKRATYLFIMTFARAIFQQLTVCIQSSYYSFWANQSQGVVEVYTLVEVNEDTIVNIINNLNNNNNCGFDDIDMNILLWSLWQLSLIRFLIQENFQSNIK